MATTSLPPTSNNFTRYESFSGVDIRATFHNVQIGEIQAVSYSITREKAPIYVMGRADPMAFSRGKRGIAGSLVFIVFDKHSLLYSLANVGGETGTASSVFSADSDEELPAWASFGVLDATPNIVGTSNAAASGEGTVGAAGRSVGAGGVQFGQQFARPWYADQIPPFDITLLGANEYGSVAVMKIIGVDLMNEGYGVSIDDIASEMQYTYMCRSIIPWTSVQQGGQTDVGIRSSISSAG